MKYLADAISGLARNISQVLIADSQSEATPSQSVAPEASASPIDPPIASDVHFTDSPCYTCNDPCTDHPQLPGYLAKNIDVETPLHGTMKPYRQHILVRVGLGTKWAEKLGQTPNAFFTHVDDSISNLHPPFRSLITAFESSTGDDQVEPEDTDCTQVLLFPQNIALDRVHVSDIGTLADCIIAYHKMMDQSSDAGESGLPVEGESPEIMLKLLPEAFAAKTLAKPWGHKTTVMVCTHKRRDKRCGVAGPLLMKEFNDAVKEFDMDADVGVYGVSHFGGHKFAGNIIIYRYNSGGQMVGDWYGRVRTCHARPILETTVKQDKIFKELWRGRMDAIVRKDSKSSMVW
ncbi:hypothetical protein BATDEDRAFT_37140 [Batrachochytrium dendrobatidis JAM81]|uniref:Sucrase/ferredoxin-like family protein n=1 Tax=Batrachochytrium dendrobatidis (strain JAM81 / FGSC 10211) TaxID=684364 RepID=F4P691_BATDJ|nr:uncharacterized protein BATDEDRAFT_37140 [Batrachochytrium dendrobatidis JAM81]EGF79567.1 hypothetical protein BATDEDRAFT_37140 [Batrachochytrium dendrobatidis JAM81]|eukprot:XP_006680028.1 hypothetical protein BATDEDRAFT_37140 [Batrachochytrium dendrobatidis JAM81]